MAGRGRLLRVLGVAFGAAIVVGGTIGQGIFRTPGLVAQGAPDPIWIVALWAIGGLVVAIDAMSTVELATSVPSTGGPYAFATRALGRRAGLAVGTADILGNSAGIAFVAVVFAEYLHRLGLLTAIPLGGLAAGAILALGTLHWFSVRLAGGSQEIGSAIKAVLFFALVMALLFGPKGAPEGAAIAAAPAMTLAGLVVALRGIFGTYSGWNSAAYFTEEVVDPGKDITRATFMGVGLVSLIYVLVNIAYLRVLTPAEMAGSNLVAAEAAARVFGPRGETVVTVMSVLSVITLLNAAIMVYPRVVFALARDAGVGALTAVSPSGAPRPATALVAVIAALLALVGVYDILLALSASLLTALGVMVNLSAIVLRRREPDLPRPYRMPFFPVPAVVALIINAALLAVFVIEDVKSAAAAFAILAAITSLGYWAQRRAKAA